jgi:hypothetical protein
MGEWEDIFKEDPSVEGQMVNQGLMQHARLQTIITCIVILLSLQFYTLIVTVELLVARNMIPVKAIHVSYVAALQSKSGRPSRRCLLTHILNGSTTVPHLVLWWNLTSFGQFLY